MADIITLKQICTELKLDPRESRERLRAAARDAKKHPELAKAHKARAPWSWTKGLGWREGGARGSLGLAS
jgi:hypothetical protein